MTRPSVYLLYSIKSGKFPYCVCVCVHQRVKKRRVQAKVCCCVVIIKVYAGCLTCTVMYYCTAADWLSASSVQLRPDQQEYGLISLSDIVIRSFSLCNYITLSDPRLCARPSSNTAPLMELSLSHRVMSKII